jgi:hypothetical protein
MTDVEREHIWEVLAAAGITGNELEWMTASCPSLAAATDEAQRRWRKRVEARKQ